MNQWGLESNDVTQTQPTPSEEPAAFWLVETDQVTVNVSDNPCLAIANNGHSTFDHVAVWIGDFVRAHLSAGFGLISSGVASRNRISAFVTV